MRATVEPQTAGARAAIVDLRKPTRSPRPFWVLAWSGAIGVLLAIVWSPSFVDQTIGETGATTILGTA